MNDDNDDATMTDVSDTFCDVAIPMMILPEESSDTFGDERDSEREAESSCATTTTTTTTALASRPLLPSVSVPEVHGRGLRVMNHAGRILWKAAMGKQGLSAGVWAKLLQRTLGAMIFGSTTASALLSSSSSSGGNNSNSSNNNWLPSVWPAKAQSSQEEEEEAEDCWNEEDINCNYNYNDECEAMEESPAEISPLPEPEPLPSSDDRSTATKRNRWSTLLRWPGVVVSDEEEEEGDNDEPIDHRGYDGYKYHQDREVEDYRPRKRVRTGLSW